MLAGPLFTPAFWSKVLVGGIFVFDDTPFKVDLDALGHYSVVTSVTSPYGTIVVHDYASGGGSSGVILRVEGHSDVQYPTDAYIGSCL
jgi:hypothetical protein